MKEFLFCLLICFSANAQVSDIDIVQNLKNEVISDKSKTSEELRKILEKYFNDKCKVVINSEEIILNKNHFGRYAGIVAAVFPKIKGNYKLEVLKNVSDEDLSNKLKMSHINTSVKLSEKQSIKIDFVLEKEKLSEVRCKDVPLTLKQRLILKGVFNLLRSVL